MTQKQSASKPSEMELAILSLLWENGKGTVRSVHEQLNRTRPVRYTTTLKQMQVMHEKGMVKRDESSRTHIYKPTLPQVSTERAVVKDLMNRVFGGSAEKLVMHALKAKKASASELAQIRQLLDSLEGGKKR